MSLDSPFEFVKGTSKYMKREFGVKQVGFFISMFIVEDKGFCYKNKKYAWGDIIAIKRDDDFFAKLLRCPSSTILLSDGTTIIVPATLEVRNNKTKTGSDLQNHGKRRYNEFISIFESKTINSNNVKFQKYLCSGNYVMFYRWLIAMSIVFTIFILSALFVLKVKLNNQIELFIFSAIWLMVIGVFMLVRRHLKESIISKELDDYKKNTGRCSK